MIPTRQEAEAALQMAQKTNPGPWVDHSRFVALACERIARHHPELDPEKAYIYGLLHDIGRYPGRTSERHLLDGYRFCMERGWEKAAQICVSHAFMIQNIASSIGVFDMSGEDRAIMAGLIEAFSYDDYDRLVQLCDSLALPEGFCLLEKRFVDVTLRYGIHPYTVARWKAVLAIKQDFEEKIGCSVYDLLPGVMENSLR